MANNLSVVIGADTSGFLKAVDQAKNTLNKYKSEANSAAGEISKLTDVSKEQVTAYERVVKSLGKVGSGTMTTAQQAKTLQNQIKELQIQWANLSDKAKSSDFGKSISQSISTARTQLNQLNTQLEQTTANLGKMGENSGGNGLSGIAKSLNFGNVEQQIQGVTSSMAALGLQGGATISALSGGAKALLNPYTAVAAAVAGTTYAFVDYNSKLSEQTEKVRQFTGATGDQAIAMRSQAKSISDTYGSDFNETVQATNSLAKQMGISFEEAGNAISMGFAAGADANGELLESVKEYPAYLKEAGIDATGFMNIISQSVKEGVFSDKGVDAIKEANLRLREMTPATQQALSAIGMSSTEIQKSLANGSKTTFQVIQEVSKKLQKLPDSASEVGQALADIFGGPGEDAGLQYIRMLGDMDLSQQALIANMSEQGRAQYELQQADNELEDSLASLFGVSEAGWGTMVNQLKTQVFQAISKVINKFIDLYNSSTIVRGGLAAIGFAFTALWDTCKTAVKLIGNEVSGLAKIFEDLIKGDFTAAMNDWGKMQINKLDIGAAWGKAVAKDFSDSFNKTVNGKINKIKLDRTATDQGSTGGSGRVTGTTNGGASSSSSKSKTETALQKYTRTTQAALTAYSDGLIKEEDYLSQQINATKSYISELSKNKSSIQKNKSTIEQLNTKLIELQGDLAIAKVVRTSAEELEDNTTRMGDGMLSMSEFNNKYRSNLQKVIDAYYSLENITEDQRKAQLEYIDKLKKFDANEAAYNRTTSENRQNVLDKKLLGGLLSDAIRNIQPNSSYTQARTSFNSISTINDTYNSEKKARQRFDTEAGITFDEKGFNADFVKKYHDVLTNSSLGLNVDEDGLETTLNIAATFSGKDFDKEFSDLQKNAGWKGDKSNFAINATSSAELEQSISDKMQQPLFGGQHSDNSKNTYNKYTDRSTAAVEAKIPSANIGKHEESLNKLMDLYKRVETAAGQVQTDLGKPIDNESIQDIIPDFEEIQNILANLGVNVDGLETVSVFMDKLKDSVEAAGDAIKNDLDFNAVAENFGQLSDISTDFQSNMEALKSIFDDYSAVASTTATKTQKTAAGFDLAGKSLNMMGSAMSTAAAAFDSKELNVAGIIAQALATLAVSFAEAMVSASSNWVTWLAFGVTGLATLITMTSQIKEATSAANGGIIKGTSQVGDHNLAFVNSGEMILNSNEQGRLFRILNGSQPYNATTAAGGNIEFTLYGEDLYGSINNYNRVHGTKLS